MSKLDRTDAPVAGEYATVHIAFELSKSKWKLGVQLPGSSKLSRYTIAGGDLAELTRLLGLARTRAERSSGKLVRVLSCYEAGYDGHWLLQSAVIFATLVDMPSISLRVGMRTAMVRSLAVSVRLAKSCRPGPH
jgi:hypothetical protein